MTDINPRAFLRVYDDDREAFGHVYSPPTSLTFDLPTLVGDPASSFVGFDKDPTGTYLMQQMKAVYFPAGPGVWAATGGRALPAVYSSGTEPSTGAEFLYHQSIADAFNVQLLAPRTLDEGFYAAFYIGAATALQSPAFPSQAPLIPAVNFYIEFSRGREDGEPGLRLALEPGKNIRLQLSKDGDATWTDVAAADALGECESYLAHNNQKLYIAVLPMTDASWEAGLPATLDGSSAPPNKIIVSINGGDAVLTYTDDGLAEGRVAITGQNRQWSCRPALMRFAVAGSVKTSPQFRPGQFQVDPDVTLNGYAPDGGSTLSGTVIVDSPSSAHMEMTLAAVPDATGFAVRSCFLASVDAEFPAGQIDPSVNPSYIDYPAVFTHWNHHWNQTSGTGRSRADIWLSNQNDEFAPGPGAALGVRAATLFTSNGMGVFPPGTVTEEKDGVLYAAELTGWTAMEPGGMEWIQQGNLKYFRLSLSDKLVHTEDDTAVCCGFQLPYDFQSHYYAFGQQAYRIGIPDSLWKFPVVRRSDAVPGYYLSGGTTRNPLFQFSPSLGIGQAMERIRGVSAEEDPVSQTPLPMVIDTDSAGSLLYYGLPVGVVSLLANPALSLDQVPNVVPVMTFSAVPYFSGDGNALLNEFVQTWESRSSLRSVRNPVVVVGQDPRVAGNVFSIVYNENLGGSRYADPTAAGYIAIDKPLFIINELYSSTQVADLATRNAAVQLAVPSIDTGGQLHVQPGLRHLMVVAVNDYTSQGTNFNVGYYLTEVSGTIDLRGLTFREETVVSGRILGLSA